MNIPIVNKYPQVIMTLYSLEIKHHASYSFPSQTTLLRLLHQHHGITICRRTLNYQLRWLQDHRFINRLRRISNKRNGSHSFRSTLYSLRSNAVRWLKFIARPLSTFFVGSCVQFFAHHNPREGIIKDSGSGVRERELAKIRAMLKKYRKGVALRR